MNDIYIIFYISSIVISSLSTIVFIKRHVIMDSIRNYFSKRKLYRERQLKIMVKRIVLDYLKELKDE